jgi:hypothetical protein
VSAQLRRVGIKDVGVIGVDSGWEIYVAGNGGIKTEVAQFLVKVKSAAEVLEYAARSCSSIAKKAGISSAPCTTCRASGSTTSRPRCSTMQAGGSALWERLQFALDGEPDPWHEPERARMTAPVHSARSPCRPQRADRTAGPCNDRVSHTMERLRPSLATPTYTAICALTDVPRWARA